MPKLPRYRFKFKANQHFVARCRERGIDRAEYDTLFNDLMFSVNNGDDLFATRGPKLVSGQYAYRFMIGETPFYAIGDTGNGHEFNLWFPKTVYDAALIKRARAAKKHVARLRSSKDFDPRSHDQHRGFRGVKKDW